MGIIQPPDRAIPLLDDVAEFVKSGQCILFLGAGVHSGPPPELQARYAYAETGAPPRGGDLSAALALRSEYAHEVPNANPRDLQRVAMHYEATHMRTRLLDAVVQLVDDPAFRPSPVVRALAALNFPLVITTNYDRLYEMALGALGKDYDHGVYSPRENAKVKDIPGAGLRPPKRPYILKIHGDIRDRDSIVITEDDYIRFVIRMVTGNNFHPVPLGVRSLLAHCPTLFVGYSLADYNLRVLFRTLRWTMDVEVPATYAVDPFPDPLLKRVYAEGQNRQLSYIVEDAWTFVPALYRAVTGEDMPA